MDNIEQIDKIMADIVAMMEEIENLCPKGMKVSLDDCTSSNEKGVYRHRVGIDIIYPRQD